LTKKLAGITRERFDVTALAFGIKGVKSQRALARTAHARKDDKGVPRYLEIDIPKIVLPSAANDDLLLFHFGVPIIEAGAVQGAINQFRNGRQQEPTCGRDWLRLKAESI
jgi:hypothetical protein